jgi:hypothetical protein
MVAEKGSRRNERDLPMIDNIELEIAVSMMRRYKREIDSLKERYGTGVRPSWVSTDLALAWDAYQSYERVALDNGWIKDHDQ